jgi:hypothetical protein
MKMPLRVLRPHPNPKKICMTCGQMSGSQRKWRPNKWLLTQGAYHPRNYVNEIRTGFFDERYIIHFSCMLWQIL